MPIEVLEYLAPDSGESYLDLTAGYGGHASLVIERTKSPNKTTLVDRDASAVDELTKQFGDKPQIIHADFFSASEQLVGEGKQFDMILADLGVSSLHLDKTERGFSFKNEAPLDMRMDERQKLDAYRIVNTYKEDKLTQILKDYGQEPKARSIAKRIIRSRPVRTTTQLADIAKSVWPGHSKVHPATRTFQALRIAVNDELGQLERSLPLWLELLNPGGRLVVISFHSLEDAVVKQFLKSHGADTYDADLRLLTKKPITASTDEIVLNPRARSAKLRAAAKIKNHSLEITSKKKG